MTERFLSGSDFWSELKKLAKRAKPPRRIAVPYLGKGAATLLPLRRGDLLVVNMTQATAKAGSTCPAEVAKLQRKGVRVYTRDDLHAKVYLMGRKALVASANLSIHSRNELEEAGLLTTDPATLRHIRDWFDGMIDQPVTPKWLSKCSEAYREPHRGGRGKRRTTKGDTRKRRTRVWLAGVSFIEEFPESEIRVREHGQSMAREQLKSKVLYESEPLRAGNTRWMREAKQGDLVIQVSEEDGGVWVYPHGRLLRISPFRNRTGASGRYLHLEMPKHYRRIAWKRFKPLARAAGLTGLNNSIFCREIRDRVVAHETLSLVSPERLMTRKKPRV